MSKVAMVASVWVALAGVIRMYGSTQSGAPLWPVGMMINAASASLVILAIYGIDRLVQRAWSRALGDER